MRIRRILCKLLKNKRRVGEVEILGGIGFLSLYSCQTTEENLEENMEEDMEDDIMERMNENAIKIRSAVFRDIIEGDGEFDVLVLDGDFDLDLTVIGDGLLRGIEAIDLSGTGDNVLTINAMELLAIGGFVDGGKRRLIVEGNTGDGLVTTDIWEARGTMVYERETYNLYEQGEYQLLVDRTVSTVGAMINERINLRSGRIIVGIDGGLGFDVLVFDGDFDLDLTSYWGWFVEGDRGD